MLLMAKAHDSVIDIIVQQQKSNGIEATALLGVCTRTSCEDVKALPAVDTKHVPAAVTHPAFPECQFRI